MINMSFLTLPDPRIKPSGSRDPLGFQTIWVKLGRELVGSNLTTITSSIDNFIIALLASHYSFQEIDEDKKMEVFFKVEQLGAYFRIAGNYKNNIMGITQAQKNYTTNNIVLGDDGQIFGNQKTSGLWGYYSSALMMSGLVNKDKDQVQEEGSEIVNKFLKVFSFDDFLELSFIGTDTLEKHAGSFIKALGFVYKDMVHFVLQKSKFDIYSKTELFFQSSVDNTTYQLFYDWMQRNYTNDPITIKLLEIKEIDKALWIASKIFEYCRTQKGKTVNEVAKSIEESTLAMIKLSSSDLKIKKFIELWNSKQFKEVIYELEFIHSESMKNRSSAKWLTIKNDKLNVTVAAKMSLPKSIEKIPWQYNYFLHSYISVAFQVYTEGKSHE
ncbi:hypothetical protein [Sulfurimonas sp.]|jgi:hypothetical protein|uniref:hypothetical protein n=1 Tax=Sulfurimonas sp. TaxID=2022749 RepID=UPI0025EF612A|nr:hypothetical protein [Sulfurimonas sp.]MBT5934404.1 hypothetical protein [Sulfurimonas sp.]